jgi:transcriptional antiterminator Rof (Rho-off)
MSDMNIEADNDIQDAIEDAHATVAKLDEVQSLFSSFVEGRPSRHKDTAPEDDLAAGKMNIALAFGLASLYFSLHNINGKTGTNSSSSSGKEAAQHPILGEINRIKQYVQRAAILDKKRANKEAGIVEPDEETPTLRLDKDAASRMIMHNLEALSHQDDDMTQDTVNKSPEQPKNQSKKQTGSSSVAAGGNKKRKVRK